MPKVSVIIPSYNHGLYIEQAVESVLEQTFQDWELLISDDASNDDTLERLARYKDHPRIRCFCQRERLGAVQQIHFLTQHASGSYIALLNSDDFWLPSKLQEQVAYLEQHKKTEACFTQAITVDKDSKVLSEKTFPHANIFFQPNRTRAEWLNDIWHHGNSLCHPSILARRGYDREWRFNAALRQLPDLDVWVSMLLSGDIYVLQKPLTAHRRLEDGNVSADSQENYQRLLVEQAWIFEKMLTSIDDKLFVEAFNAEFISKVASAPYALTCEKFFLMLAASERNTFMRDRAVVYFMNRGQDEAFMNCMKTDYHYGEDQFYALSSMSQASLPVRHDSLLERAFRKAHCMMRARRKK